MNECHLAAFAALLLLIIKDHNQVDNRPCCPLSRHSVFKVSP